MQQVCHYCSVWKCSRVPWFLIFYANLGMTMGSSSSLAGYMEEWCSQDRLARPEQEWCLQTPCQQMFISINISHDHEVQECNGWDQCAKVFVLATPIPPPLHQVLARVEMAGKTSCLLQNSTYAHCLMVFQVRVWSPVSAQSLDSYGLNHCTLGSSQRWATVPFYLGSEVITKLWFYIPVHYEFVIISELYKIA